MYDFNVVSVILDENNPGILDIQQYITALIIAVIYSL